MRKEFNLLTTLFPYTNMAAVSLFHTSIWTPLRYVKTLGSLYVSGKLPTYPSSKPALTLTPHLGQNVGLRGRWAFFRIRIMIEMFYILILLHQLSPSLPFLSRQASARGRLLHQGRAQGSFSLAGWGQEAGWGLRLRTLFPPLVTVHGVKKVGFTAYHLGMLLLVCTSSRVF